MKHIFLFTLTLLKSVELPAQQKALQVAHQLGLLHPHQGRVAGRGWLLTLTYQDCSLYQWQWEQRMVFTHVVWTAVLWRSVSYSGSNCPKLAAWQFQNKEPALCFMQINQNCTILDDCSEHDFQTLSKIFLVLKKPKKLLVQLNASNFVIVILMLTMFWT